jgi:hypothetical protein
MDTKVVDVRKNINVHTTFNAVSSFTFTIDRVDFIPDEVIVRGINYSPAVNEVGITLLYTNLVNDHIGSFFQNFYIKPNLHFPLKKPVKGTYTFQIQTVLGDLYAGRVGDISIDLEFVKYKEVKEGKIY